MNDSPGITCEELIAFLADYLSDELAEPRREAFERHLLRCRACVAYLATYGETIRMSKCVATAQLVSDVPEELVIAVREAIRRA